MFAVKGWSVPAEKLTSEATGASAAGTGSNSVPVKKRKRPNSKPKIAVTDENVGELWEKFIQNKKPRIEEEKQKEKSGSNGDRPAAKDKPATSTADGAEKPLNKRQRQAKKAAERKAALEAAKGASNDQEQDEDDEWNGIDEEPQNDEAKAEEKVPEPKNAKKEDTKAKDKKSDPKSPRGDADKQKKDTKKQQPETAVVPSAPPKPAAPKLTPLQAAMREKLISARFRHLNETLYTRPSAEAFDLFKTSPDMFVEYHEGFRRQVAVWPENPIDGYIADILVRARVKPPRVDRQHRHQRDGPPLTGNKAPLPRARDGSCTIADLGCGDAKLGAALQPQARKLNLDVRSFDLQTNGNPMIMAADMADLPLADGSVDVAIFCLALMGTNWVDFVEEAYRVLRWKGELWVAEIKSRFAAPGKGKKGKVVEHSVGNRRNPGVTPVLPGPKSKAGKANKEAEAAAAETDLAIEVDGEEDKRQETDVSAFVDVLAKRGFVLRGEPSESVDLSNRMFVKMYFVKGATPVKGKGVAAANARDAAYKPRPAKQAKKFIEGDEVEVNEAAVLKPCVYKIR
ncbi:Ribosomal RNA-processing protein 8 [Coniochaeta hoffmannii]|uniref:Ribosomal RNA-processing protein 8 n=1 Tax=Coniochaeta hoffmannii TaxID=91930 RepID=A0AA38S2D1_9PEZI|nr:Ribosomal RNA-processing protein 8 [Coniochaeta hoffmannii]